MKFRLTSIFLLGWLGLSVIISGCKSGSDSVVVQSADHWIVLNAENAQDSETHLSWQFQLNNPGKYDIQILSKGPLPSPAPVVQIEVAALEIKGGLKQDYLIEAGTVSQLRPSVTIGHPGNYQLTLKTEAEFDQVRIIPNFKNGFGSGKYTRMWEAMRNSPKKQAAMAWFKEAKYGMFIHWGIYSQAGGIWKGKRIEDSPYPGPRVAEWLMSTFRISREEYAELAKSFNPDKSFAQNIAKLAKDAGMKYMVITSKHHDGFALFDSACSDFDMVDATPYKADAIKELYDACQAEGIEFGVYYSHGNDWRDGTDGNYANVKARNDALGIYTHLQGKNHWDPSPNTHAEYLESKAYPQIRELIQLMPKLRLIWFDGEGFITEEQAFRFYKLVYDLNPSIIVNRRVGFDFGDYLDAGDNVVPAADAELPKHWETCGTTNNSWGYKSYDDDWKSTKETLYWFIDIASKGGNYLLNIGPDGKGRVPEESARRLREVGDWLKINGEAIYGTTRWKIPNEGQNETPLGGTGHRAAKGFQRVFTNEDFWFTYRKGSRSTGDKVYAISLAPANGTVRIRSLNKAAGTIKNVRLLGEERVVKWIQTNTALEIDLNGIDTGENGFAIEAEF